MKKVIIKLDIFDEREKKKAYKTVSSLSGIESISIDMNDGKLTIIGDVDPISVVNKLRKLCHTELLSVGPNKEDDKKKEEEKKKNEDKEKDGEKKTIQDLVKAYHNYNPYIMPQYVVHGADEYPNSCTVM